MSETRRCQHCGGAMPTRTHRRTHPSSGLLVGECCINTAKAPEGKMTYSTRHVAHDSGDGADINHCPFCGSGSVIGGHSGTVECEFCHRNFTVQVQPEFRGMPQSVNGQPFNVPGMPGGGPDAGAADEAKADAVGDVQEGAPKKAEDPGAGGNPFAKKPEGEKKPNPFAAQSMLVTKEGMALPTRAYLQHLALAHADDREAVLAQVRDENRG